MRQQTQLLTAEAGDAYMHKGLLYVVRFEQLKHCDPWNFLQRFGQNVQSCMEIPIPVENLGVCRGWRYVDETSQRVHPCVDRYI
jgi:hypothetical protein